MALGRCLGCSGDDDSGGKEDDRTLAPLQTEHGSTPSGGVPGTPDTAVIRIENAINAANPLLPTAAEDADRPLGPVLTAGTARTLFNGRPLMRTKPMCSARPSRWRSPRRRSISSWPAMTVP